MPSPPKRTRRRAPAAGLRLGPRSVAATRAQCARPALPSPRVNGKGEAAGRLISIRPSDRRGPGIVPGAAICVQDIDVQCVLQFTLIHAASCALHRHTSRVIHRLELFSSLPQGKQFRPYRSGHRVGPTTGKLARATRDTRYGNK